MDAEFKQKQAEKKQLSTDFYVFNTLEEFYKSVFPAVLEAICLLTEIISNLAKSSLPTVNFVVVGYSMKKQNNR